MDLTALIQTESAKLQAGMERIEACSTRGSAMSERNGASPGTSQS